VQTPGLAWDSGRALCETMRILLAIVHHWNPEGGGAHGSLSPDPTPRIEAFEQQLLALQRLGTRQAQLSIAAMQAQPANQALQHQIEVKVITDGEHHVLDRVAPSYKHLFQMVVARPSTAKHLGFEAQQFLASRLDQGYDLYGYMEDDLIIQDPWFFRKIEWFSRQLGDDCLLLPHRYELNAQPHAVDRFYIDGPMHEQELQQVIPNPSPPLAADWPGGRLFFESPSNPHAGCFFLTPQQLNYWIQQPCWQDGDCSWVSPLESAATLGIAKTFRLFKPAMRQASWLELQHWGISFHCLIGRSVALLESQAQSKGASESISPCQDPN
jgi:hypothetical protein